MSAATPRRAASARPRSASIPLPPASEYGAQSLYTATRSRPCWRIRASASARAGRLAASGSATRPLSQRRRSFFMDGLQPGTDRPHRFLAQRAFKRRHVHPAVAHRALADALQKNLVALVALRQVAQVGRNAAGNPAQAVAAGTVLVVGGIADADRGRVLAVGIAGQEIGGQRLEAGGIDCLRLDVAVCH